MTISRRNLVLSIPAVAATGLLSACGGSGGDPAAEAAAEGGGNARAQAVTDARGGLGFNAVIPGSWPSTAYAIKPDDALVQAVLNGNDLHVSISHVSANDYIRTVTATLRKYSAWADNTLYTFYAGTPPTGANGTVEGLVTHFRNVNSSDFATSRMIYAITSGAIEARKQGGLVTLTFSPRSDVELNAKRLASTSTNYAPSSGQVKVDSSALTKSIILNVVVENETSA